MNRATTLIASLLAVSFTCIAGDDIQASVTPTGAVTPVVTTNGNPYSVGTFGVGTIQLWYTVTAYQFQAGSFATFQLGLTDVHYNGNPTTNYPVSLKLDQTGSTNLTFSASPSEFSPTGPGWAGTSLVGISIPATVPLDPSLNVDGAVLVGNLQL